MHPALSDAAAEILNFILSSLFPWKHGTNLDGPFRSDSSNISHLLHSILLAHVYLQMI